MDFNDSFGLVMVDFGQHKISDQISSVYIVLHFNGSFGLIMIDLGGTEIVRQSGLTLGCIGF